MSFGGYYFDWDDPCPGAILLGTTQTDCMDLGASALGGGTKAEHLPVLRKRPGIQLDGHRYVHAGQHRSP